MPVSPLSSQGHDIRSYMLRQGFPRQATVLQDEVGHGKIWYGIFILLIIIIKIMEPKISKYAYYPCGRKRLCKKG